MKLETHGVYKGKKTEINSEEKLKEKQVWRY